jgi:hypothetical protein
MKILHRLGNQRMAADKIMWLTLLASVRMLAASATTVSIQVLN